MVKLALKLNPQANETIMSLVSRLAARNGPSFVQDFCLDMNLNWQRLIYSDPFEIEELARLLEVDSDDLMPRALVKIDQRRCKLNGQLLAARTFIRREQKVCPVCLESDEHDGGEFGPFGRREWLLATFRVCPIHNCQLIMLPFASFPRHHADFFRRYESCRSLVLREVLKSSPPRETDWETYLLERLSGLNGRRWIDQFDLDAAMRIVQSFGVIAAYGPHVREADLSSEELSNGCHVGFSAASGTADQFYSAMNRVSNGSRSKKPGFFTDFGMFARWCTRVAADDRYRSLIDIVTKFTFENYPTSKGEVLCGRVCPDRNWHNCSSAAEEFGGTHSRMSKLIEALDLGERKLGKQRVFRVEEAQKVLPDLLRCIPRIQCIRYLGAAESLFGRLVERALLKPKYELPQVASLYDPDEVEQFLSTIRTHTKPVALPSEGSLDLKTVCNAANCFSDEILSKILSGELRKTECVTSETGLGGLRFNLEDVLDVFEGEPTTDLTKAELRSVLCVNAPTIKMLIETKKLKSRVSRHHRSRRPRRVVRKSEVEMFLSKYVSLGELAKKENIQANWVAAKLARSDIHPIELPSKFSKLYLREVVEA